MDHDDRVLSTQDTIVPHTQTQIGIILNNLLQKNTFIVFICYMIFFL